MLNIQTLLSVLLPLALLSGQPAHAGTPEHAQLTGPYGSVSEVTAQCLSCHAKQGEDILHSSHWTWKRERKTDSGSREFSKKNGLTTFALAAGANPSQCLPCHISSNLLDNGFDPTSPVNIDCLVCHDTSGTYGRENGAPVKEQNLAAIAAGVGTPTTQNCMTCHGVNAHTAGIKMHGGIQSDIHLQSSGAAFSCQTCHPTGGTHSFTRTPASQPGMLQTFGCAVCHTNTPHIQKQLNEHAEIIACSTCHIPTYGRPEPAIFGWNWFQQQTPSLFQAGNGTSTSLVSPSGMLTAERLRPVYLWDDGLDRYYQRGEKVDRGKPAVLLGPGERTMTSKITPFAPTFGTQLMDGRYRFLISPVLEQGDDLAPYGHDWTKAAQEGMTRLRLPFSGQMETVTTVTYTGLSMGLHLPDRLLTV